MCFRMSSGVDFSCLRRSPALQFYLLYARFFLFLHNGLYSVATVVIFRFPTDQHRHRPRRYHAVYHKYYPGLLPLSRTPNSWILLEMLPQSDRIGSPLSARVSLELDLPSILDSKGLFSARSYCCAILLCKLCVCLFLMPGTIPPFSNPSAGMVKSPIGEVWTLPVYHPDQSSKGQSSNWLHKVGPCITQPPREVQPLFVT